MSRLLGPQNLEKKKMKRTHSIMLVIAIAMMCPCMAVAQGDSSTPIYVTVDCMKASGPGYVQLEQEVWKPVHQYLVNQGKRSSWALYEVVFGDRTRCDYFTVTTFRGVEQLNAFAGYEDAFSAVHPKKDIGDLMAATGAARTHVSTELWQQVDQTELKPHSFAVVNKMYAPNHMPD